MMLSARRTQFLHPSRCNISVLFLVSLLVQQLLLLPSSCQGLLLPPGNNGAQSKVQQSKAQKSQSQKSQPQQYRHYFAYGSNMLPDTMIALRNIEPISYQAAVLPNYKLRFTIPGIPKVEPSAAVVERIMDTTTISSTITTSSSSSSSSSKNVVHGVLYTLTLADFLRVGMTEGVPFGYQWEACHVIPYIGDETGMAGRQALGKTKENQNNDSNNNKNKDDESEKKEDGGSVLAYTLIDPRRRRRPSMTSTSTTTTIPTMMDVDIPPSKSYRDILIDGATLFHMDTDYINMLKGIPFDRNLWIPNGISGPALEWAKFQKQISRMPSLPPSSPSLLCPWSK